MKWLLLIWTALTTGAAADVTAAPERNTVSAAEIRPPAGRLAIVADGNSPDPDDIGALAVMLGLLKGAALQERLVHLSHSCDLDPFSNPGVQTISAADERRRQDKLEEVCRQGIEFFGPFANLSNPYNCRTQQAAAVADLRDAINASTAEDPLWILEAGEPDVIGYALREAQASKRSLVHVVSHHPANDNSGDVFTWQEILDFGVIEHQIGDQNKGLHTPMPAWNWAQDHAQPEISWIWAQLKYAEQDGVVTFQTHKFDCSDAGILHWWITGANEGGHHLATPTTLKPLLLQATQPNPSQP